MRGGGGWTHFIERIFEMLFYGSAEAKSPEKLSSLEGSRAGQQCRGRAMKSDGPCTPPGRCRHNPGHLRRGSNTSSTAPSFGEPSGRHADHSTDANTARRGAASHGRGQMPIAVAPPVTIKSSNHHPAYHATTRFLNRPDSPWFPIKKGAGKHRASNCFQQE